jgi:uncharacterized protein YxjI
MMSIETTGTGGSLVRWAFMPRYFFNLRGDEDVPDGEGTELADPIAAREFAFENAREIVCADIKRGWLHLDHAIDVVDDQGRELFTITFRDAFDVGK